MPTQSVQAIRVQLPGDLRAPSTSRRLVERVCASAVPEAALDTLLLLTSEVVTNACVHARSAPRLTVVVEPDRVRVEVEDDEPAAEVEPRRVDAESESGRGLALVEHLASRWGAIAHGHGKVLWFEVTVA